MRLNLDEFGTSFLEAWSRTNLRFLKIECRQSYREREVTTSQAAHERGDVQETQRLLRQESETERSLYEDVERKGIDYARIRLTQEPLTPYLDYELIAYRIRSEIGENIEIVRCASSMQLPDKEHFDFLLFDRHTALIHNYGEIGLQSGGWMTQDAAVITSLEKKAVELRQRAIPFEEFLAAA
ncbi:DUF6879 family protein [Streptosporangium sp. CA-135522]|uniref:DUF6879 family protein n=1 Tax=Streptosporangium sp. CA-135522 TaxID=3240072 RepID=UPI003D89B3DF